MPSVRARPSSVSSRPLPASTVVPLAVMVESAVQPATKSLRAEAPVAAFMFHMERSRVSRDVSPSNMPAKLVTLAVFQLAIPPLVCRLVAPANMRLISVAAAVLVPQAVIFDKSESEVQSSNMLE